MRDRLIEIFKKINYKSFEACSIDANLANQFTEYALNHIVDKLIDNGVIVPPVKVGDTVYIVDECSNEFDGVDVCTVSQIINYGSFLAFIFDRDSNGYSESYIGKTVFLTREEAEQALKGGAE